jgi:glycosyltransferase involved in cell wall biosynthesis
MKISVVIPTIGRELYLDVAINSLLNQNIPFDEILVFDNSELQNLSETSVFRNDERVTFGKSGLQLKAFQSWNNAVQNSSYEYVCILGDDDIALPNFCESIRESLSNSDVVLARGIVIDEHGKEKEKLKYPDVSSLSSDAFRARRMCSDVSLFVPGIAFKKELFIECGGFLDTQLEGVAYSDELLLYSMSYKARAIGITDAYCWQYRVHNGQIGNIKTIKNIITTSFNYLDIYEKQMASLGASEIEAYSVFSRNDYFRKVMTYRLYMFSIYASKNLSYLRFSLELFDFVVDIGNSDLVKRIKFSLIAHKVYFQNLSLFARLRSCLKK